MKYKFILYAIILHVLWGGLLFAGWLIDRRLPVYLFMPFIVLLYVNVHVSRTINILMTRYRKLNKVSSEPFV